MVHQEELHLNPIQIASPRYMDKCNNKFVHNKTKRKLHLKGKGYEGNQARKLYTACVHRKVFLLCSLIQGE